MTPAKQGRNVALRLRFVGTAYHGWQVQENGRTVAGTVERAILDLTGEHSRLVGCGRTDAGVHALKYVANFRTGSALPAAVFPRALNARLPEDIRVLEAWDAPWEFHAIADCVEKEYTYLMAPGPVLDPFLLNRVFHVKGELQVDAMARAAERMVGRHDFRGLRSLGTPVKSTVRSVRSFTVEPEENLLVLKIRADGFLYNMARTMAGTVYYAGLRKLGPPEVDRILETGDRSLAGPTLPAQGLYLTDLVYRER